MMKIIKWILFFCMVGVFIGVLVSYNGLLNKRDAIEKPYSEEGRKELEKLTIMIFEAESLIVVLSLVNFFMIAIYLYKKRLVLDFWRKTRGEKYEEVLALKLKDKDNTNES